MENHFDQEQAKKNLQERESKKKELFERERTTVLRLAIQTLQDLFRGTRVAVYLIGSILEPGSFRPSSDVDVVLKNFTGDRFEIWSRLESSLNRKVEVIIFEDCHFQDYIKAKGYQVL